MKRSFAFLRAVNVGGRTVKMDRLRAAFEALGLANVATFIASGNVVFDATRGDAARLEQRIERALAQTFGFEVVTFVRSQAELHGIAAHRPFEIEGESGWFVGFARAAPSPEAIRRVEGLGSATDVLHVHGREVYWLPPAGRLMESTVSGGAIEKALGGPLTVRNVNTVQRMVARFAS